MWLEPMGQDKEITLTVAMGLELTGVNLQVVIEMEQIPEANSPKVIDHSSSL